MTALAITLALVAVVAAASALAALLAWRRALAAAVRREDAAERDLAELRERLSALETAAAVGPASGAGARRAIEDREFVITRLGDATHDADGDRTPARASLTAPAFADAVLRESVVQTASLVQGLRHALAPEGRNRVRFAFKQELRRTRKARRVELKEALREYRARHRADVPTDVPADVPREDVA